MNNQVDMKKQIFTLGTIAALSALAPQLTAADVEVKGELDKPKSSTRTEVTRDKDLEVSADLDRDREKIRRTDKASGIIGMEVRNRENQKLGEIKDFVLDVNSGRLSYAVLSVGGFLGIGEKLIALPSGSLKAAGDGEYLVLDADKSKIQAAPGFAATAWPAPNDPEIHRFWGDIRATGSPATSESGKKDIDVDVDVDKDRKGKIYTDADRDRKIKIEAEKD
jgi:sporulation protein YlmC with PRC-barrel domain